MKIILLPLQIFAVFIAFSQESICKACIGPFEYTMVESFFSDRPVMIVIDFMSNGSLDSFLQVY